MGYSSKTYKLENQVVYTKNNEPFIIPLEELTKMINIMEANLTNQES
jgi:hypothetical protein